MSAAKKIAKIPLSLRLKAWWEGYDTEDLARYLAKRQPAAEPPAPPAPEKKAPELPVITPLQGEAEPDPVLPIDPWDQNRIDVAQLIWGRGFCGPGGPEYVIAMSKLLTLTPEMSMMHLGAGLGGPARTLAEHFGVWVTGYETSESLVAAGSELSAIAGLAKKASLTYLDLDEPRPFERKYDRALVDDFLSLIPDKQDLLVRIEESLKPDGLCLITDYFLASDRTLEHPDYRDWMLKEPRKPCLVHVDELVEILQRAGYNVRVNDDLSADYVTLIDQTWAGADQIVAQLYAQPGQAQLVNVVCKEAELWARRARLLRGGHVTYRRLLAAKRSSF